MFRAARPDDFPQVVRLYRQLNPDDPHLTDGSDERAFARILATEGPHLFVLEVDGACGCSGDAKTAYLARPS